MSGVTGPPAELAARRDELTPMLRQYVDLCEAYDDALVLFRVGDFYKTYCEIAETVARVCELTLIEREDSTGTYTAAGIPVDNATSYLERLLDAGHRVAIADQVEDPDEAQGLVDRAVTQVITPGTVVDDDLLAEGATYVAAVLDAGDGVSGRSGTARYGIAAIDVSTGECQVTSTDSRATVEEELDRLSPAELLMGPGTGSGSGVDAFDAGCPTTPGNSADFDAEAAEKRLAAYADPDRLDPTETRVVGGLLAYAEYTQGDDGPLEYVSRIRRYDPRDALRLDAAALRSLEVFENRGAAAAGRDPAGETLLSVLDETATAPGRRRLEDWLRRPLVDRGRIAHRLDAVADLHRRSLVRNEVRDLLAGVYDLERLVGRASRERADARDLRSLAATLGVIPDLREALTDAESDRLRELRDDLDDLADVRDLVESAIVPDPPGEVTEGGIVREGFHDELDELRATAREGREWVENLEERERERTGIDNLEVGHNQVHGYYIEVTDGKLDLVPDDYERRQTLKHSERFVTPELRRREDEIVSAMERANALEYEVFREVRADVAGEAERIQAVADALATLDVLAGLAAVAAANGYVRPDFHPGGDGPIEVEAGRHPVVERTEREFVPNDAAFDPGDIAVITGPNMSGKSTYMRQVALAVVMGQMGSFVPARAARLPVVDRVFTRVGASDDIAGGQSTFMREMAELTDILHDATPDSLVLLDEVGRGTSTADGRAIARAAVEFMHEEIGATTLFATHYHELTGLADDLPRVRNLHFTAVRDGDDVTFLHQVTGGASSSSYGIEVARMAGVPDEVVERSRELVDAGGDAAGGDSSDADGGVDDSAGDDAPEPQRTLADVANQAKANGLGRSEATSPASAADPETERLREIADELREVDPARTTPLEALNLLNELRERLQESEAE